MFVLVSLKDSEDEVRAVAADALIPLCCPFFDILQQRPTFSEYLHSILNILWNHVMTTEDFTTTASIASIMNLLGPLFTITFHSCTFFTLWSFCLFITSLIETHQIEFS